MSDRSPPENTKIIHGLALGIGSVLESMMSGQDENDEVPVRCQHCAADMVQKRSEDWYTFCPHCGERLHPFFGGDIPESETDSESKTKDDVYYERNILALAFIREQATRGNPCGWTMDEDSINGEEYAVVWTDLIPQGQVGWHVPVELVPDWLPMKDPDYDGYSTEEKNGRVEKFAGIEG